MLFLKAKNYEIERKKKDRVNETKKKIKSLLLGHTGYKCELLFMTRGGGEWAKSNAKSNQCWFFLPYPPPPKKEREKKQKI